MVGETNRKILEKLAEQARKEVSLPRSLEFYRELLRIQSGVSSRIGLPKITLSEQTIKDRLAQGSPVLKFDDLVIDWGLLKDIFEQVTTLFASTPDFGTFPEELKNSNIPLQEIARDWYEGRELSPVISTSSTNEAVLEAIVQAVFRPFLVGHSEALIRHVDQENWRRRYCPICGGSPDFAFLDKERGARWLLCSRCDARWLFQRLECPYCGTQDQRALGYFTDDEGFYRLYVCEKCRHYLKAVDLRKKEEEVLLPLERLLTMDIDIQAHQEGYSPGTKGLKR